MTSEKAWRSAPPFDHIVVGLPGDVVEIEPPDNGRGRKWRVAAALGVLAVVLAGGLGAAQAVQRTNQAQDSHTKAIADVSREELQEAKDIENARTNLAALFEDASRVDEDARALLTDEDAGVVDDLAVALARARDVLDHPVGEVELSELDEATAGLRSAMEEAERALEREVVGALSDAVDEANDVLGWSAGSVLDETSRVDLRNEVEEAQDALDAGTGSPRALAEMAARLVELTQAVRDAVIEFQQQSVPRFEEQPSTDAVPPAAPSTPRDEPSSPSRPAPAPAPSPSPDRTPDEPAEPVNPPTEPTEPTTEPTEPGTDESSSSPDSP